MKIRGTGLSQTWRGYNLAQYTPLASRPVHFTAAFRSYDAINSGLELLVLDFVVTRKKLLIFMALFIIAYVSISIHWIKKNSV